MTAFTGYYKRGASLTAASIVSSDSNAPTATSISSIRVTFDQSMKVSTFTTGDVVFTNPSGAKVYVSAIKEVAGTYGKTFDIVFSLQSAPGTYTLKVGPYVTSTAGVNMTAFTGYYKLGASLTAP